MDLGFGKKPENIKCIINGKILFYDACSEQSLEKAQKYYYNYNYIGTGHVYSVDGVLQHSEILRHFFVHK